MTVIGAASRQKVATVHTGSGAHSVSPSPDGKYVLVPNAGDATVSVVTIPSFKVQTTLHVDAVPMAVVFSADGSTAYLAHAGGTFIDSFGERARVFRIGRCFRCAHKQSPAGR